LALAASFQVVAVLTHDRPLTMDESDALADFFGCRLVPPKDHASFGSSGSCSRSRAFPNALRAFANWERWVRKKPRRRYPSGRLPPG
jgi:hypothetical protein